MKTAIIITGGVKQITLTPETPYEKQALSYINSNDDISIAVKCGSFVDATTLGLEVSRCQGDYLRAFTNQESVMLVLKPKENKENK